MSVPQRVWRTAGAGPAGGSGPVRRGSGSGL